jgi:hypothetical protein
MDDPNGPNGPVAYSEVFEGRFDGARLARYLAKHRHLAGGLRRPHHLHHPHRRPALRIAQLGYDTIAASNMPTPEQIHAMLDRYRAAASPFSGSSLLAARYRDVPLLSSAWGIGHVGLPFSERGRITVFGLELPLPEDTTFVASLRYGVGGVRLRVEQIAPTEEDAARSAQALGMLVQLPARPPSPTGTSSSPGVRHKITVADLPAAQPRRGGQQPATVVPRPPTPGHRALRASRSRSTPAATTRPCSAPTTEHMARGAGTFTSRA